MSTDECRQETVSGYVSPFIVRWYPPAAYERFKIEVTGGKSGGVSGLEVDAYSTFAVRAASGAMVATFSDEYFENANNKSESRIKLVRIEEGKQCVTVEYHDGKIETYSFSMNG